MIPGVHVSRPASYVSTPRVPTNSSPDGNPRAQRVRAKQVHTAASHHKMDPSGITHAHITTLTFWEKVGFAQRWTLVGDILRACNGNRHS